MWRMKALSDTQFQDAVKRHALGETLQSIATDFGIEYNTLRSLKHRHSSRWRNIERGISRHTGNDKTTSQRQKTQRRQVQQQKRRDVLKEIFNMLDTRQLIGEIIGQLMQWHGMSEQEAVNAIEALRKQQS